ncbi:hypothetical protein ACFQ5H_20960 [Robinsoniella peoriensis]
MVKRVEGGRKQLVKSDGDDCNGQTLYLPTTLFFYAFLGKKAVEFYKGDIYED